MTTYSCGDVYFLPAESRATAYPDDRRHVLLVRSDSQQEPEAIIPAAYSSTSPTPSRLGAACHHIDVTHPGNAGCGFDHYTYVYPGIVTGAQHQDLTDYAGSIGAHNWSRIHALLRRALGIGTGIRGEPNVHRDSWRGVVIRVDEGVARDAGFLFGVVVTEHKFSAAQEWFTLVPILNESESPAIGCDFSEDVGRLLQGQPDAFRRGVFTAEMLTSVFHNTEVAAVVSLIKSDVMRKIDAMLATYFQL